MPSDSLKYSYEGCATLEELASVAEAVASHWESKAKRYELDQPVEDGWIHYYRRAAGDPPYRAQRQLASQSLLEDGDSLLLKWEWDGAASFAELIARMRGFAAACREAARRGLELDQPIDNAQGQVIDRAAQQTAFEQLEAAACSWVSAVGGQQLLFGWDTEADLHAPVLARLLWAEVDSIELDEARLAQLAEQLEPEHLARVAEWAGPWVGQASPRSGLEIGPQD